MFVKYLGPRDRVNVLSYGIHEVDEMKEYPDEFGRDLIDVSTRQEFIEVDESGERMAPERKDDPKKDKKPAAKKNLKQDSKQGKEQDPAQE